MLKINDVLTSQFGGEFHVVEIAPSWEYIVRLIKIPIGFKPYNSEYSLNIGDSLAVNPDNTHKFSDIKFVAATEDNQTLKFKYNAVQKELLITQDNLAVADETIEVLEELLAKTAKELEASKKDNEMLKFLSTIPDNKPTTPPWTVGDKPFWPYPVYTKPWSLGDPIIALINGQPIIGDVEGLSDFDGLPMSVKVNFQLQR